MGAPHGSTPHLHDVEALAVRVNRGDLSAFDMNNVVTEMAVQTAMLHQDRCVKNRYYYHDPKTGKWTVIPYDMKARCFSDDLCMLQHLTRTMTDMSLQDAFATDNRGNGRNCAAEGNPCRNTPTYCILSCESFNSPLFCDATHPQDTFPESDGRSTYNRLVEQVLRKPEWREAYFRRLRYIMDNFLSTGWLQAQVAQIKGQIYADARLDNAKWRAGDIELGVAALLEQMRVRRGQLYGPYGRMIGVVGANASAVNMAHPVRPMVSAPTPASWNAAGAWDDLLEDELWPDGATSSSDGSATGAHAPAAMPL